MSQLQTAQANRKTTVNTINVTPKVCRDCIEEYVSLRQPTFNPNGVFNS